MKPTTLLSVLALCLLTSVSGQTPRTEISDKVQQLLTMPAPRPRSDKPEEPKQTRPPKFFDSDSQPPDDAPIADLLEYWSRWVNTRLTNHPSDVVKKRLLDACLEDPDRLSQFLPLIPSSEDAATKVKETYDKPPANKETTEYWREPVKKWLLFNSKYFLSELLTLANKVQDDEKGGYVKNEDALTALSRIDWASAEPLLQRLSQSNQPRTTAAALSLLYKQAQTSKQAEAEEKYRQRLREIASDTSAPASARDSAIEALSLSEWSGRDDWYISLLADETLRECHDGIYGFHPLTTLFNRDPDKWIQIMSKLVESKDRAVQQAAGSCLVSYATNTPRRDAILPVLRWLSDPDWIDINGTQRAWFMQKMDELEMPESVPGLIWIVENEESNRRWAARTLAHYKDPSAIPALKKALATENNEDDRNYILDGLVASGGISDPEALSALEAYVAKIATAEGREEVKRFRSYRDDALPVPVSVGRYLANVKEVSESLVHAVLARAEVLKKRDPLLAQSLLDTAHQWQGRHIDLDLIHRIADGSGDATTIAQALERRTKLRESVGPELQALAGSEGLAPGIAAVLLDDSALAESVLSSDRQAPKLGLLAAARLTQMPLPVETVGALLKSKEPMITTTAHAYLLAEDSPEARALLWAHHPGEAFITGWRENIQMMSASNFDVMGITEEKLRAELFKEGGPLEVIALITNSQQYSLVLRVYDTKAVYRHYEDAARYRERMISKAELAAFKDFVTTNNLMELGPQFSPCHHDCWISEFLVLTKEKGRRVFGEQGLGGWLSLLANFDLLQRGAGSRTHYAFENEVAGLERLYEDDTLVVKDVWKRGSDLRILVEREETLEEINERNKPDDPDDDDAATRTERQRQEIMRFKSRFTWRALAKGTAGDSTSLPEGYTSFDETRFPPADDEDNSDYNNRETQAISPDTIVIARNFDGLWRQTAGQKPIRISGEKGAYAKPIATADGKWVVLSKADTDWSTPNYIARFNLKTGREYRVAIPPAANLDPIAYLPNHDKILIRRAKDDYEPSRNNTDGPETPEFYLLDANTGQTQTVTGIFTPLQHEGKRFLQPTANPNEFWAAVPKGDKTQVGRYNLKDFTFQPVVTLPQIEFDSMQIWVDEAETKVYLVYRGQLLRFPLKQMK